MHDRRPLVLLALAAAPLAVAAALGPIDLPADYHAFADRRLALGIRNAADVLSNLAFLAVGLLGLARLAASPEAPGRRPLTLFFGAVAAVAVGSAHYHLAPDDATLLWDRLPMTIAFVAALVLVLTRVVSRAWERALGPLVVLGVASALHWRLTGDVRVYAWVQLAPLLVAPAVLVLYREREAARRLAAPLSLAVSLYVLAKVAEVTDVRVFEITGGVVSGHTLKHLLAASATACLLPLAGSATSGAARCRPFEDAS